MSEHTPGPWRVDPKWEYDVQTADGLVEIATVSPSVLVGGNEKPRGKTLDANVRLIAAAPDLLDAITMLTNATIQLVPYPPDVSVGMVAIVDMARAAIAKATATP